MTNLSQHTNIWTPASEAEKAAALGSLAGLPSRVTSSEELDRAAFYIALEGVTRHGLSEAVKSILRGGLGHAFFPSPPELRMQCDKAMEWHIRESDRIRRLEEQSRARRESATFDAQRTPQAKSKVSAAHQRFLESYDRGKQAEGEADRTEIRARYGMTDELLARVNDRPSGGLAV